jgi:hypothetical protein
VLAGEVAAALARVYQDGNDDLGTAAAVTRVRTVLAGLRGRELS